MKRTALKRKTPLKKISKKRQDMLDRETEDRNDWTAEQGDFCWLCGYTPAGYGMGNPQRIDTHEMVRLSEHTDAWQRPNYSRVCRPCHEDCHGGKVPIEKLLALKMIYDASSYYLPAVQAMRTQTIDRKAIEEHYQRLFNQKGRRK